MVAGCWAAEIKPETVEWDCHKCPRTGRR